MKTAYFALTVLLSSLSFSAAFASVSADIRETQNFGAGSRVVLSAGSPVSGLTPYFNAFVPSSATPVQLRIFDSSASALAPAAVLTHSASSSSGGYYVATASLPGATGLFWTVYTPHCAATSNGDGTWETFAAASAGTVCGSSLCTGKVWIDGSLYTNISNVSSQDLVTADQNLSGSSHTWKVEIGYQGTYEDRSGTCYVAFSDAR